MYTDLNLKLASAQVLTAAATSGYGTPGDEPAVDLAANNILGKTVVGGDPGHNRDLAVNIRVDTSATTTAAAGNQLETLICSGPLVDGSGLLKFTDTTVTAAVATDLFTISAGHGFQTGSPIYFSALGTTVVTGLSTGVIVFAIPVSATTFKIATTPENALAGVAMDVTTAGTVVTLQAVPTVHGIHTAVAYELRAGNQWTLPLSPLPWGPNKGDGKAFGGISAKYQFTTQRYLGVAFRRTGSIDACAVSADMCMTGSHGGIYYPTSFEAK